MPVVALLVELVAGDLNLLGVHDDDEVARVDMRRVGSLALAPEHVRDARSQPPEGLALGIDDVPLAGDLARFCAVGLHTVKKADLRASAGGES